MDMSKLFRIDYGLTNDPAKFVTEISIPVEVSKKNCKNVKILVDKSGNTLYYIDSSLYHTKNYSGCYDKVVNRRALMPRLARGIISIR